MIERSNRTSLMTCCCHGALATPSVNTCCRPSRKPLAALTLAAVSDRLLVPPGTEDNIPAFQGWGKRCASSRSIPVASERWLVCHRRKSHATYPAIAIKVNPHAKAQSSQSFLVEAEDHRERYGEGVVWGILSRLCVDVVALVWKKTIVDVKDRRGITQRDRNRVLRSKDVQIAASKTEEQVSGKRVNGE